MPTNGGDRHCRRPKRSQLLRVTPRQAEPTPAPAASTPTSTSAPACAPAPGSALCLASALAAPASWLAEGVLRLAENSRAMGRVSLIDQG